MCCGAIPISKKNPLLHKRTWCARALAADGYKHSYRGLASRMYCSSHPAGKAFAPAHGRIVSRDRTNRRHRVEPRAPRARPAAYFASAVRGFEEKRFTSLSDSACAGVMVSSKYDFRSEGVMYQKPAPPRPMPMTKVTGVLKRNECAGGILEEAPVHGEHDSRNQHNRAYEFTARPLGTRTSSSPPCGGWRAALWPEDVRRIQRRETAGAR